MNRDRPARILARTLGLALAVFGFLADFIGGRGSPGMGTTQWALVAAGAALWLVAGLRHASVAAALVRLHSWAGNHDDRMRAMGIALFAVAVGLLTGIVETAVLAVHRFGLNGFVRAGPHLAWMAPLSNAAVLLTIGGMLLLGGRLWPKLVTPAIVGSMFFFLAADAVLHRIAGHGQISGPAKMILLLGFAVAAGPPAARWWDRAGPHAGRTVAALLGIVALAGIAATAHPGWKERRALAALPPAPSGGLNVILIILDTVRAASLSLYGYDRPTTPELDHFSNAGVSFTSAVSPSSWTLPSHATLFTGRHPHEFTVDWVTPLDDAHPMLAEVLSDAGYATAAFSANVGYVSNEAGLARGFARFEDFVPTPGEAIRTSTMLSRVLTPFGQQELVNDDNRGRRFASDINGAFLAWLDDRPTDRPYFAFLNYFDAHAPYYAPPPFDTLFGGVRPLPPMGPSLSAEEITAYRDAYDRSLVYLDSKLGVLFRDLERRGELDRTLIVITSDHGEHFGEHGFMDHARTLYRPVIEVPLVVRGPGVPAGIRIESRVGLRDLAATILDLTGAAGTHRMPGRTLATTWESGVSDTTTAAFAQLGRGRRVPSHYPNSAADLRSVTTQDLHYIVSSDGTEELFRISSDPEEKTNLVGLEGSASEEALVRRRLRSFLDDKGPAH